jgi:hypothetical protein
LDPNIVGWLDDRKDEKHAVATVRDTNGSLDVILVQRLEDGKFYVLPWLELLGGAEISRDAPPGWKLAFTIAGCKIALPQRFAAPYQIDKTIAELEKSNGAIPSCWQESKWLSGELFLILDENLCAKLMGESLYYNREYGLYRGE